MSVTRTIGLPQGGFRTVSLRPSKVASQVAPARRPLPVAANAVAQVASLTLDMVLAAVVIAVPVTIVGTAAAFLANLLLNH